jgi:hypothetical protein
MIRNVPTTSATAANTSRKVLRKPRISCRPSSLTSTTSSPVRAVTPSGSSGVAASWSCSWDTPSAAVSEIPE